LTFVRRRLLLLAAVLTALFSSVPSYPGWASLGPMPAPSREGRTLVFRNAQGTVALTVLAPEIVRVRFAPGSALGRDHSYAVVKSDFGDPAASFEVGGAQSVVRTSALRVTIRHDPFRISFASAGGESLDEDDPLRGTAFAGKETRVWKRLRDDEHVYGFGEKTGRLDKRGRNLGGYGYVMWNTDAYAYGDDTDPIYVSVPFFIVMRGGRAHGFFLDNTFRSTFDVGRQDQDLLAFGAPGGEMDYYFIDGPTPKQVVSRYTELTGRMPLPPRWALGYHQSRYSYYPEDKVRFIAENFRQRRIPADVIWLDVHYLEGFNPFTWNRERFPDPPRLMKDLRAQGFRVVPIVDPHPKKQKGWWVYDTGISGNHFVKNPDGSVYEAPVWPSNAEKDPGPSVFPDFTRPATREWWGGLLKHYTDAGVAGIWNDMNEPAVFVEPTHTMALDVRHDNEGQPTDEREIHNVYGMLNSRATFEGLLRLRPDERPFILTRATYAGGQRYAAVWSGDNVSSWAHLRMSIPMFANLGLSGFPFVGADIGGFAEVPTAELYTRWLQLGVFYPFMRSHTVFGTPDQEPWSYGSFHEALNRRAIEMRYELLPQIYNVMEEASRTGVPAFRPLLLDYPDDPATWDRDDEFLFGSDLLVAPVLREDAADREVYLPAGDWYDYHRGWRFEGRRTHLVPVTMEAIPVFVRGGAFIFRQPVVQHTGEMAGQPLRVAVFPAARSEASLYEDAGQGRDQRACSRRRFTQRREGGRVTIDVAATEGSWRPAPRDIVFELRGAGEPSTVTAGGAALTRLEATRLAAEPSGWTRTDQGVLVVKLRDRAEAFTVTVEQ
jgi:alpha-glucosidase